MKPQPVRPRSRPGGHGPGPDQPPPPKTVIDQPPPKNESVGPQDLRNRQRVEFPFPQGSWPGSGLQLRTNHPLQSQMSIPPGFTAIAPGVPPPFSRHRPKTPQGPSAPKDIILHILRPVLHSLLAPNTFFLSAQFSQPPVTTPIPPVFQQTLSGLLSAKWRGLDKPRRDPPK